MRSFLFYVMKIRLTQIDGKLPNLALMKLSHYFKSEGHEVYFEKSVTKGMFEPKYDFVFGSAIFSSSSKKIDLFRSHFPSAIVGGTGSTNTQTVEQMLGFEPNQYEFFDYSIYPNYKNSIGFTQRGCRLRCKFCVVPEKEGKIKEVNTLTDIWRGEDYPKNILLLDNDFFGQSRWKELCNEAIENDFKVSFSQGINIRLIHKEGAELLSKVKYYDGQFKKRQIYTAWDNKRDEKIFRRGIGYILDAGIKAHNVMVYTLCNYWTKGLTDDVWFRIYEMAKIGLRPYVMVYDKQNASKEMKEFQTWVIMRKYPTRNNPTLKEFKESFNQFLKRKKSKQSYDFALF